jgi:hypothetical protein
MKRIADIFRFTFISPEFAVILLLLVGASIFPDLFSALGQKIKDSEAVSQWLPTLPILFCGITFRLSSKVRAPFEAGNRELYQWAQYNRIIDRLLASYILCVVCCLASLYLWVFAGDVDYLLIGQLSSASMLVSALVTFNIFIASHKIREVMELYGSSR